MKKYIVLLLLVVFIAGCTGTREVNFDKNNGIVINAFEVDYPRVDEGEDFTVYLEMENVGGTTATDVRAYLYGVSWNDDLDGNMKEIGVLSPPDIIARPPIPGDFQQIEWNVNTPDLQEGIEQAFRLLTRVHYIYRTNSIASITGLSKDEYRRKISLGEESSDLSISEIDVTNTPGPISISVSGYSPMIVDQKKTNNEFVQRIEFTNVGSGVPITGGEDGKIRGVIEIDGKGAFIRNCLGSDENSLVDTHLFTIDLRRGQSLTKSCTIVLDKNDWADIPENIITLKLSMEYEYFVDAETQITVLGFEDNIGNTGGLSGSGGTSGGSTGSGSGGTSGGSTGSGSGGTSGGSTQTCNSICQDLSLSSGSCKTSCSAGETNLLSQGCSTGSCCCSSGSGGTSGGSGGTSGGSGGTSGGSTGSGNDYADLVGFYLPDIDKPFACDTRDQMSYWEDYTGCYGTLRIGNCGSQFTGISINYCR